MEEKAKRLYSGVSLSCAEELFASNNRTLPNADSSYLHGHYLRQRLWAGGEPVCWIVDLDAKDTVCGVRPENPITSVVVNDRKVEL